ncbi:hypothetical protein U2F26_18640 [Micromonospora sp. 4G57]|nr:hypothetical protein [Micromonospora sp. 4G57]MDZ5444737.1 hypothetical protein [Micromonospora sp. 4G57]
MPKNSLTESAFVWREEKWVAWTDPADVLRRTRDDAVRIKIGADFEILNEGNASVYIRFIGRYLQAGEEYRFLEGDEPRVFLAPGETTVRRLQGEATLERWSRH